MRARAGRPRTLTLALALAAAALAGLAAPASASRNPLPGERVAIVRAALGAGYPVRCVAVRVSTAVPGWAATGPVAMRPDAHRQADSCELTGHVFDGTAFVRRIRPNRWRLVLAGSSVDSCDAVPLRVQRDLFRFARAMDCPAVRG